MRRPRNGVQTDDHVKLLILNANSNLSIVKLIQADPAVLGLIQPRPP